MSFIDQVEVQVAGSVRHQVELINQVAKGVKGIKHSHVRFIFSTLALLLSIIN